MSLRMPEVPAATNSWREPTPSSWQDTELVEFGNDAQNGSLLVEDEEELPRERLFRLLRKLVQYPVSLVLASIISLTLLVLMVNEWYLCVPGTPSPPDACNSSTEEFSSGSGSSTGPETPDACLSASSYFVIWVTLLSLLAMCNDAPPDISLLGATAIFRLTDVITPAEAWQGFCTSSILAIAALFVVARCLEETRTVEMLIKPVLGRPRFHPAAVLRLCIPAAFASAFLNNTPLVAMLLSIVENWAAKCDLMPSVLLMPLSFASIMGGTCTQIGSSTNMVLAGLIQTDPTAPCPPFGMFTMTPVALPAALVGIMATSVLAPLLLRQSSPAAARKAAAGGSVEEGSPPDPPSTKAQLNSGRWYSLMANIETGCELVGQRPMAVERLAPSAKGGTHQSVVCLLELRRQGVVIGQQHWAECQLEEGDRMSLSCLAEGVTPLRHTNGLRCDAEETTVLLGKGRRRRCLAELCLSPRSPLVGLQLPDATAQLLMEDIAFWSVRGSDAGAAAAVSSLRDSLTLIADGVAAAVDTAAPSGRKGAAFGLRAGDTILVEAQTSFIDKHRSHASYVLVASVPNSMPPRVSSPRDRARVVVSILAVVAMLLLSALGVADIFPLAIAVSYLLIAINCITLEQAWGSINFRVILATASSFGLGAALEATNVTAVLGQLFVAFSHMLDHVSFLFFIFAFTSLISCVVSNAATVVLFYHVLKYVAVDGLRSSQMMICMMLGASTALATPIGYQTNLMVLARGGYRFGDFFVLGGVLTVLMGVSVALLAYAMPPSVLP